MLKVYKNGVLDLSVKVANEAAKHHVRRFVEVSTAQVYNSDSVLIALSKCPHAPETKR